ncbi:WD40 repeat-like protein [Ramicandelaber brevisporus]|nr:WD40 repeat-like protein [Ramicandelaber brevisporus]
MNTALIAPFGQEYPDLLRRRYSDPEAVDKLLRGHIAHRLPFPEAFLPFPLPAQCLFNRAGTHLAVGCLEGCIVIWDCATLGAIRVLVSDPAVSEMVWSRCGRYLAAGHRDGSFVVWDLKSSTPLSTSQLGHGTNGVVSVAVDPINGTRFAVALSNGGVAYWIDHDTGGRVSCEPIRPSTAIGHVTSVCSWRGGQFLLVGTGDGSLAVIAWNDSSMPRNTLIWSFKATNSRIHKVMLCRAGKQALLSGSDRVLRLFDLPFSANALPVARSIFQDVYGKTQWTKCQFSHNNDYVVASAATPGHQLINIWDKDSGVLVHTLEGSIDYAADMTYHRLRPILITVAADGSGIYEWSTEMPQLWSAYDPRFTELEGNAVRIEREDEFEYATTDDDLDAILMRGAHAGTANATAEEVDMAAEIDIGSFNRKAALHSLANGSVRMADDADNDMDGSLYPSDVEPIFYIPVVIEPEITVAKLESESPESHVPPIVPADSSQQ